MPQKINIALSVNDSRLSRSVRDILNNLPDVDMVRWNERKSLNPEPQIILVDDTDSDSIFPRLRNLRRTFNKAAIFVISPNKAPEHIIKVMKSGGSEYLIAPLEKESLLNAVKETVLARPRRGEVPAGTVYSFMSSKGGLGATFLAVNAAEAIADHKNNKVVLWDMCFQSGDSTVMLDIVPENTVTDICRDIHRLDKALLQSAVSKHKNGIDVLSAPKGPMECREIKTTHTKKLLDTITQNYDYLFIDCTSATINDITIEAFKVSKMIAIVIDLSVPAIRNAARIQEVIKQIGIDSQQLEYVVNRHVKSNALSIEEAEKTLRKNIFWLFPNDFSRVMASINDGEPLICSNPRCALSKSIKGFAGKIREPERYQNDKGITKKGFLRRALPFG